MDRQEKWDTFLFRALGWDTDDTNEVASEENASKGREMVRVFERIADSIEEARPME